MSKANRKEISLFKREVLALLFLSVGLFLYLSLLSYHPFDPSFSSISTAKEIYNWGGAVGAYLADSLISLFGGGAYFIGFFFLLAAAFFFIGRTDRVTVVDVPLYFIFVLAVAVFLDLTKGFLHYDGMQLEAGGFLGGFLARLGVTYLGRPGAYLVLISLTLLSFVWATRLSLRDLGLWVGKWVKPVVMWLKGQAVVYSVRAKKSFDRWREQRKVAPKVLKPAEVKINRTPVAALKPEPVAAQVMPAPKPALLQAAAPAVTALAPEARTEPKILERADKKLPKPPPAQLELRNIGQGYQLPPINLLDSDTKQEEAPVDEESLKMNARLLEKKLMDFNVEGQVTEIHPGPVITMYEFQPAPGVKLSRIANLADDLCLAMGGRSVRIVAPLPNKPAVGIEIPNNTRETVWLKDIVADDKFQKNESKLVFAIGKDIEGIPFVGDLAKMPHLLVAGATGSGKSVSINTMILSILYKATPEEVRLIMVDPKMLELSIYGGIPHLLLPVVTEPKKASLALRWAVREMERRYKLLSDINARNIQNYNKKIEKGDFVSRKAEEGTTDTSDDVIEHNGKLPYIVIIIDELADLMMVSARDVEESITRLAQMARAAGIHLILATQRPSVDVLTGVIKANFPARISFKVSSKHDARTVLDTIGSEKLLGNGDMLFIPPGASRILRVHGAFITETEVSRVVDFLKAQAKPVYDETILKPVEAEGGEAGGLPGEEGGEGRDEFYDQAVAIVAETKQASISMIQRKLRVGYNRAARMIERMEQEGIVSPPSGAGHRQVLVSSFEPAQ